MRNFYKIWARVGDSIARLGGVMCDVQVSSRDSTVYPSLSRFKVNTVVLST